MKKVSYFLSDLLPRSFQKRSNHASVQSRIVLFFDKMIPLENGCRTKDVWIYDLRTNMNFTLVTNTLNESHLQDFIECYDKRRETERFKKYTCEEILARDKTSLDITWIKDASLTDLENLPEPQILAASIVENLEEALLAFRNVEEELVTQPQTD